MQSANSTGITFSEVMQGGFVLGETEPVVGDARGKAQHSTLAMHATVTIPDIDRFVADPNHPGTLRGTIDFTPWQAGIAADDGLFNLFSPSSDTKLKLMVYELPFTYQGERYYLAGRKEVRDDPGFDLWSDTTTLLTTLHRGHNRDAPVVGAGVLRLDIGAFAKVVGSVRVTGTDDPIGKAAALATFGRFFAGELWERYAAPAR